MSRNHVSASIAESTGKPSRFRLAAVVYAFVLIMGLAGAGAHALWSQNGTAVSSVTTGKWAPQGVTGVQCSAKKDGRMGTDTLIVMFTAPSDADVVKLELGKGGKKAGNAQVPVSSAHQYKAEVSVASTWFSTGTFDLSVTPSYGGISGASDERAVTVEHDFWGRVKATC